MAIEDVRARLGLDKTAFDRGLHDATSNAVKFGKNLLGYLGFAGGASATIAGIRMFRNLVEGMRDLRERSEELGVSAKFIQQWSGSAEEMGFRAEAAETALQRFSRRIGEAQKGTGVLAPILEELNIDLKDAEGRFKSTEQIIGEYSNKIRDAATSSQRLRLAVSAMDMEGAKFLRFLKDGEEGLEKIMMRQQSFNDVAVRQMANFGDKSGKFFQAIKDMAKESSAGLLLMISDMFGGREAAMEQLKLEKEQEQTAKRRLEEERKIAEEKEKQQKAAEAAAAAESKRLAELFKEEDDAITKLQQARGKERAKLMQEFNEMGMSKEDIVDQLRGADLLTLEELARVSPRHKNAGLRFQARQALRLQDRIAASPDRLRPGMQGQLDSLLQGPLGSAIFDPNAVTMPDQAVSIDDMKQQLVELNDKMNVLVERATGIGLNIQPKMGE